MVSTGAYSSVRIGAAAIAVASMVTGIGTRRAPPSRELTPQGFTCAVKMYKVHDWTFKGKNGTLASLFRSLKTI